MAFFRTLFSKTTKPHHYHQHGPPLVFDIPEILDLILSFIDDFTLRKTVALVCQQWCRLAQNHLLRAVVWDSTWTRSKQDAASSRTVGAGRLFFNIFVIRTDIPLIVDFREEVATILTSSQKDYQRQGEQTRQQSLVKTKGKQWTSIQLYKFSPLKDLHLDISTEYHNIPALDTYIVPISTLTTLVLTCRYASNFYVAAASLSNILQKCPALEFFEARALTLDLDLTWTLATEQQQHPLSLRSLIIENVNIKQDAIENILLFTPRLKVLQLIGMSSNPQAEYNWPRLAALLLSLPITLDKVHFSTQEQQLPRKVQQRLLEVCPVLSEWHLWALNTTTSFLKDLGPHTYHLTTLILYSTSERAEVDSQSELIKATPVLHHLLSTSDSIVHLTTLKAVARLQDLDIHRRRGYVHLSKSTDVHSRYNSEKPKPFTVWRCRGLQTLHLEVHGAWEPSLEGAVQSRIIFGYVSRVFPALQELSVTMPSECSVGGRGSSYLPAIRFELEGGLCLLTRLKHLQRLEVRCGGMEWLLACLKESDLNWMIPSGHNIKFRWRRQKAVEQWQERRSKEDELETFRSCRESTNKFIGTNGTVDAKLLDQLQHVGLLRDVEEVVKEMDSRSYWPLPCLEGLAMRHHYFIRPEEEIQYCLPPKSTSKLRW
ncbi:hypothetical protein EC991_006468 [Linnemannia zychae]|nr:hypothetical protein EC991_006468 [Linnemannia zychae]